jgi:hypothetical protein
LLYLHWYAAWPVDALAARMLADPTSVWYLLFITSSDL